MIAPDALITGLDHVQLAMPPGGEASAREFYATLLGLSESPKPQPLQSRGGCWFSGTNTELHLGVQVDFNPASKAHPAFLVQDIERLRARLHAAGVPITSDSSLPSVSRFYATDPFGNRLEFIQDGHGFSQAATGLQGQCTEALT